MNRLIAVLSLASCFIACASEPPVAAPPAAEPSAAEPPAPAAPPALAAPAPEIEVVAPAPVPEPSPKPEPVAKPERPKRPVANEDTSTLRLVASRGGCTKMGCPESNRCCNKCMYSWRSAEAPERSEPPKLSGVAIPEPVQKGCGVAFELELKGHYEGDSFAVASFKKVPPSGANGAPASQTVHAVAVPGACTEKKCPESKPCCNRCEYSEWQEKSSGPGSYLSLSGVAVPKPVQDGCSATFDLELTGRVAGKQFVVESFKKLPPTKH